MTTNGLREIRTGIADTPVAQPMNPFQLNLVENLDHYQRLADAILHNWHDAEDICQTVAKELSKMSEEKLQATQVKYVPPARYVSLRVSSSALDAWRRRGTRDKYFSSDPDDLDRGESTPAGASTADDPEYWREVLTAFRSCLEKLATAKPKQAQIVRIFLELNQELGQVPTPIELANRVQGDPNTTKSNLCLGRRQLSDCLKQGGHPNVFKD